MWRVWSREQPDACGYAIISGNIIVKRVQLFTF